MTRLLPALLVVGVGVASAQQKKPRPAVEQMWIEGPSSADAKALLAWLEAQGPTRTLRLPVTVKLSPLGVTGARVGALKLRADDSALGISLADRARGHCGDGAECALWLEGRWGPLVGPPSDTPTFAVRAERGRVLDLLPRAQVAAPRPWLRDAGYGVPDPVEAGLPRPSAYTLLDRIVAEVAGEEPRCKTLEERRQPRLERTARGVCKAGEARYIWTETESLETSAVPMKVRVQAVGLAGIDLVWIFALEKVGQAGAAGFRHGELKLRFADAAARARFERHWTKLFGAAPILAER